jgi:quaternary ammonium compound-resistance protein SugE
MNPWLSLFLASLMEVGWIFSLKYLDLGAIRKLNPADFLAGPEAWKTLAPLGGYVGFGLCNIVLFNMALKHIPAPTAFAVWMGLALAGATVAEVFLGSLRPTWPQIIFTLMILGGIIGLKYSSPSSSLP